MKKSLLFFGTIITALLLTGCGARPYVDVKSNDYATLQLIPKSETLILKDDYGAHIYDYSKGCDFDYGEDYMGTVKTDSDTPSRIVKIPVETPQMIKVFYVTDNFDSQHTTLMSVVLIPEKNKHYVIEYVKKEIDFFHELSEFDIYTKEGKEKVDVPRTRVRNFDYKAECSSTRAGS